MYLSFKGFKLRNFQLYNNIIHRSLEYDLSNYFGIYYIYNLYYIY